MPYEAQKITIIFYLLCSLQGICSVAFCPEKEMFAYALFPELSGKDRPSYVFLVTENSSPQKIDMGRGVWVSKPIFSNNCQNLYFYYQHYSNENISPNSDKNTAYRVGMIDINSRSFEEIFLYSNDQNLVFPFSNYFFTPRDRGGFSPALAEQKNEMFLSIPYGQSKSTVHYSMGHLDIKTGQYRKLPHENATSPILSKDKKWLFYCEVMPNKSEGAYREANIKIVNRDVDTLQQLDSNLWLYPIEVLFSNDSKTLALIGKCEWHVDGLSNVDYCIEIFKCIQNKWELQSRIFFDDLLKKMIGTLKLTPSESMELYPTPSHSFGFSMNDCADTFTFLTGVRSGDKLDLLSRNVIFVFKMDDRYLSVYKTIPLDYLVADVKIHKNKVYILPEAPSILYGIYMTDFINTEELTNDDVFENDDFINWRINIVDGIFENKKL